MRKLISYFKSLTSGGQSLVETALFLPILIFMLAGIVEVSNLLITQNRVTTSSRMAAGFGASNYDRDNWAADQTGTAYDMGVVALNTVTETMDLDNDLWDVWSIRAQTDISGTITFFEATHVYGNNVVVTASEWAAMEPEIIQSIEESLQSACPEAPGSCAADLEVVASVPFHNIDVILGLNIWQWTGLQRIRGFTVMRVRPIVEASGCPILPIAVRLKQYSLYPSNWDPGAGDQPYLWFPEDPVDLFPSGNGPDGFEWPDPAPLYISNSTYPYVVSANAQFASNTPGVPLWQAISNDPSYRGNLYWAREQGNAGNFGWLSWRDTNNQPDLEASLTYPGNFLDLDAGYPGGPSDTNTTNDPPSITGDGDGMLETGEWITNYDGNTSSVEGIMQDYVDKETWVSLMVFDITNDELAGVHTTGNHIEYRAFSFITVKIRGFSFQGTNEDKWILFEFLSAGINCGLPEF